MSNAVYTTSKLNFVDLAGSERLSKTMVGVNKDFSKTFWCEDTVF